MSQRSSRAPRHRVRRTGVVVAGLVLATVVGVFATNHPHDDAPAAAATVGRGATTTTGPPLVADRYGSRSSVATPGGASWEFAEGLTVRITGATRLASDVGTQTRDNAALTLVRIDFSYTNNGGVANVSDGVQIPVRLLYGIAQDEAVADGGYVGTSDQLTLRVPTRVERGATFDGAVSFGVPTAATAVLAVLVVEPRRYTEHLFTDVQHLFGAPVAP